MADDERDCSGPVTGDTGAQPEGVPEDPFATAGIEETRLSPCLVAAREAAPGVDCVALRGELDIAGAQPLCDLVLALASAAIVLDLSGLDFIGATGAGALVQLKAAIEQRGGRITFAGARPEMRRLFALLGLDGLLE